MTQQTKIALATFLAGFFAKDIIDCIFFLQIDKYPISVFGVTITATSHKIMLVVSIILTALFLYYGLRSQNRNKQNG